MGNVLAAENVDTAALVQQATFDDLILPRAEKEFSARYSRPAPETPSIKLDDIEEVATIGDGAFGLVMLAKHRPTGDLYALKIMKKARVVKTKQIDHVLSEKRIQSAISFPFLLESVAAFKDNSSLYVVMPFVRGGELFTHLRAAKTFDEPTAQFYAAQVVLAFEYLHFLNIVYRDLKPENIVIEMNGYIKIIDFGFAKDLGSSARTWTLCGTPEYMAPEIILSNGFGKGADWWAVGVLIYEMLAGSTPFYDPAMVNIYEKIVAGKFQIPTTFSPEAQLLVKQLLQVDLSKRYGIIRNGVRVIKADPWFKDTLWGAIYYQRVKPPFKPNTKKSLVLPQGQVNRISWHSKDEKNMFPDEFKEF